MIFHVSIYMKNVLHDIEVCVWFCVMNVCAQAATGEYEKCDKKLNQ